MRTWRIVLTPRSSFSRFPSSETLFGAICWGIKRIHGEEKLFQVIKAASESPIFILSSSFPYLCSSKIEVAFYPKPLIFDLQKEQNLKCSKKETIEIAEKSKVFKKFEYLSEFLFQEALEGMGAGELFEKYLKGDIQGIPDENRRLLVKKEEAEPFRVSFLQKRNIQKNSIDRLTMSTQGAGQTFYEEEFFFNSSFRLHFLISCNDLEWLKPVFRYLEDKGIGGNRSTGKNLFKIDIAQEVKFKNYDSLKFVTLSKYIPLPGEIRVESEALAYDIIPYRGKVESEAEFKGTDIWKSRVFYTKEGSTFEANEKRLFYGQLVEVKDIEGTKIYQNGIAFPVFGKFGGENAS